MCGILQKGYESENGYIVETTSNLNLDDIPEAVKKELGKSPASQLDILAVRSGLADNKAETKKIKGLAIQNRDSIKEMNSKFHVKVKNNGSGECDDKHMADLIVEMYERETNRRHLSYFLGVINRHRILAAGFLLSVVLLQDLLANRIIIKWIGNNFLDLLKIFF